jgi:carboxylesterase
MTNNYPIMPGAEPFYFKGDSIGCLLIHGFTGTPKEMRWLGERLAGDGHTVLGVRLAGHATAVEDMRTTRWPDWYASVVAGYRQLRAECDQVFALGLSLGGALALHLAANEQLDGIVAMATPLHIRDWRIPLLRPFQRFIPYWPLGASDIADEAMREGHLQYDRFPTICFVSMTDFFKIVVRELPPIKIPSLLIYSKQDWLVPHSETQFIRDRIAASNKRIVALERGGHIVCEDVERETALAEVRKFIAVYLRWD